MSDAPFEGGERKEGPRPPDGAGSPDPLVSPAPDLPAAKAPGRYEVRREIGRGGMGAVLEVRDRELRRRLAMKVLLAQEEAGTPAPPELLHRFLEEAQVTAQLQHPGVVPVHELGIDADGRVFFTMDLVRGRTLSEVFEAARAGRDGWSVTRAVQSLLRVCETLAYAHDRGVIHRDVKPANVMVGRFGEVYLMDWGLAKVKGFEPSRDIRLRAVDPSSLSKVSTTRRDTPAPPDSPLLTMDGAIVGTPAYMSPEQASGRIDLVDPQSDVYAVGAMLYELLAGRPPFVDADEQVSPHAVLARVWSGPPRPLHQVAPKTPPELEAIAEKAMARDRERRYRDAEDLAEDLQRFLSGHVVRAHRVGALVELRKWIARNRAVAATAGVAAVVLAAATTVYVVGVAEARREADRQRDAAEANRVLAEAGESAARDARGQAEGLLSFMLNDLRGRLEGLDRIDLLADVADRARAYHASIPADPGDDRGLMERATGHRAVAQVLELQGRLEPALASYREAAALSEALARRHPQDVNLVARAGWDARAIAGALMGRGEEGEAQVWIERALDHALRARELAPESDHLAYLEALAQQHATSIAKAGGRSAAALETARRVCAVLARRLAADPGNVAFRVAKLEADLGLAYEPQQADHRPIDVARQVLADAKALVADAPRSDPARHLLAKAWNRWGDMRLSPETGGPALEAALEARTLMEDLVARDPESVSRALTLWHARWNEARAHHWLPDTGEEVAAAQAALDLVERIAARSPDVSGNESRVATSHETLATALTRADRPAEALPHSLATLAARKKTVRDAPGNAEALRLLANAEGAVALAYLGGRRGAEAKEHALAGVAAAERLLALDPADPTRQGTVVGACHPAALACTLRREFAEAVTHRRRARELHGADGRDVGATSWLDRMVRAAEILAGMRRPETSWDYVDTAEDLDLTLRDDAAAMPYYEKALADPEVAKFVGRWRLLAIACALRVAQASGEKDAAEAARLRGLARTWLRDEIHAAVRVRKRATEALAAATTDADRRQQEGFVEKVREVLDTVRNDMPELAPWRGTPEFDALFEEAEKATPK